MVIRIRELAVQGANDTNSDEDRSRIQDEINQLTAEIDAVAERTEFNTRRIFGGVRVTAPDSPHPSGIIAELKEQVLQSLLVDSLDAISAQIGLTLMHNINLEVQIGPSPIPGMAGAGGFMQHQGGGNFLLWISGDMVKRSMQEAWLSSSTWRP